MQLRICRLLLTFTNSLDPDQGQHNFQSNLEQKKFDTQIVFFFLKKKSEDDNNKMKNYLACKELTYLLERAVFDNKQQLAAILMTELIRANFNRTFCRQTVDTLIRPAFRGV